MPKPTESLRTVQSNKLLLPHETGESQRFTNANLWPQTPGLALTCTNPEIIGWAREKYPLELRATVRDVETSLDLCSCCAFWKEREG